MSKNDPDWCNWYLINYEPKSVSLESIYKSLKKGPVIVYKSSGHYSVVYEYSGSKSSLQTKGFKMIEVKDGKKTNLLSWLNGGVNGKGNLDQIKGRR